MSSVQAQIRAAAQPLLLAATALPAGSYYKAPRFNIPESALPALLVYSHGDKPLSPDDDEMLPHERVYTLRVEIRVQERPEDDATDALATAVRRALLKDDSLGLGGVVRRVVWIDQQWAGVEEDNPISGTALDFNVHYLWSPE